MYLKDNALAVILAVLLLPAQTLAGEPIQPNQHKISSSSVQCGPYHGSVWQQVFEGTYSDKESGAMRIVGIETSNSKPKGCTLRLAYYYSGYRSEYPAGNDEYTGTIKGDRLTFNTAGGSKIVMRLKTKGGKFYLSGRHSKAGSVRTGYGTH